MDLVKIKGYEDYYAINKAGQIYSFRSKKFLTPFKDRGGYWFVNFNINGVRTFPRIHRLLAIQFIENPNNYEYINHIDENKENNNLANLEWVTFKENLLHGTRINRIAKHFEKPVIGTDSKGNELSFDSTTKAALFVNGDKSAIQRVCRGQKLTAYGYRWRYAEDPQYVEKLKNIVKRYG